MQPSNLYHFEPPYPITPPPYKSLPCPSTPPNQKPLSYPSTPLPNLKAHTLFSYISSILEIITLSSYISIPESTTVSKYTSKQEPTTLYKYTLPQSTLPPRSQKQLPYPMVPLCPTLLTQNIHNMAQQYPNQHQIPQLQHQDPPYSLPQILSPFNAHNIQEQLTSYPLQPPYSPSTWYYIQHNFKPEYRGSRKQVVY